jgi:Protein phosphatase 2C
MNIQTVIQLGSSHPQFCEDFLLTAPIGEDKILAVVADGCSSGKDSHFASTLIIKILQKISTEQSYIQNYKFQSLETQLKQIVTRLWEELKAVKNLLLLKTEELLSTALIALVHTTWKQAYFVALGDGLLNCNDKTWHFDNDDYPDYLAFHLDKNLKSYIEQQKYIFLTDIQQLTIATDGIFSFDIFDDKNYPVAPILPLDDLINPADNPTNSNELLKKLRYWEIDFGLKPVDDLAVVKLIF